MNIFENLDAPTLYHIFSYLSIKERYAAGRTCRFFYQIYVNDPFVLAVKTYESNSIPFLSSKRLFLEFKRIAGIEKNIDALRKIIGGDISEKESVIIAMINNCNYLDLLEMPLECRCIAFLWNKNMDEFWKIFPKCDYRVFMHIFSRYDLYDLLNRDIVNYIKGKMEEYNFIDKISIRSVIIVYEVWLLKKQIERYNEPRTSQ